MKRLITLGILIIVTLSCDSLGYSENFTHCNDEPVLFEKTYKRIHNDRLGSFPWHEHKWSDRMSLTHVDGNIYTLNCFGFTLETLRDGCDFIIIKQEIKISGKVAEFSGTGKHSSRVDNDSGPQWYHLEFDIDYKYDGVESNCSFNGIYLP